jgi:NADH-quinone oxidoreductase subunit D
VLRLVTELDGEIIERIDPHVGLLHRGTEKLIEYKTYTAGAALFRPARLLLAARRWSTAIVLAIEKLLDLEVPVTARNICALFFAELTRICNHMLNLGVARHGRRRDDAEPVDVRAARGLPQLLRAHASGARMHSAITPPRRRASGCAAQAALPISVDWLRHAPAAAVRRCDEPWYRQPHLQAAQCRHRDRSASDDALAWGFLRPDDPRPPAFAWDLRKSQPYDAYATAWISTFPVGTRGDCYDRFMVRVAGSLPVRAHHEAVPERDADRTDRVSLDRKVVPPKRAEMKQSMEALIHHFKLYTEGFHVPAGEVYVATESPKGEFGVYHGQRRHQQAVPLQDPPDRVQPSCRRWTSCRKRPHARGHDRDHRRH